MTPCSAAPPGSLAQNVRDRPMAEWAKQWQGRLEAGVTRGDILAEMRRNPASDASFKEWTIDKEGVMQTVERNHGLEGGEGMIKQLQREQERARPVNNTGDGSAKRSPG